MDDLENWLYDDAADVFDRDRAILEDEEQNGVRPSKSSMDVADEMSAIPARESQSLEAAGTARVAKKSYTIARKLEIVDFALKVKSIHSAAKKYNVDRKTIRVWMKKENQLRITEASTVRGGQKKNLPGAGPPLKDEMFDKRLAAWVRDNRKLGIKASHGWLEQFIARHGFELLRKARLEKDIEVVLPEEPDEDEDLNNGYKSDENLAQTSNIATMDSGTMVEALKFLNYCQLAKNSRVSKRFRDLIQTHRRKLALLYVNEINMYSIYFVLAPIKIFDKELSLEAYNEWIICNSYSKQALIESQVAIEESPQSVTNRYKLVANACYTDDITSVFSAGVELNHENWPAFQHFVRLLTDPFIYIGRLRLTYLNNVLNGLAGAIISDLDRIQCKQLDFNMNGNSPNSITWIKNHVRCNKVYIFCEGDLNQTEAFLDFFVTGAHCAPSIGIEYRDLYKVITNFVQKFMDLKNSGKSQLVKSIVGKIKVPAIELFKRDYANLLVKEERNEDGDCTEQVFEFVNNDIGKKLQLTLKPYSFMPHFLIKTYNL